MIIKLNNSPILSAMFFSIAAFSMFSVMIAGIPLVFKLILVLLIALNLVWLSRVHLLRTHHNALIKVMTPDSHNASNNPAKVWKIGSSDWLPVRIESAVIWPWILMLVLRTQDAKDEKLKLLIPIDSVSAEEYRRASIWANQLSPIEAD